MLNVNLASVEVNGCDQPILIPADVENNPVLHFICGWEHISQFGETMKLRRFDDFEPSSKCSFAVGMFFPELDQCLAGDDMHGNSLSQNEIFCKPQFLASLLELFCQPSPPLILLARHEGSVQSQAISNAFIAFLQIVR